MEELLDMLGENLFGMTRTQAHHDKVCIKCRKSIFEEDGTINKELFTTERGVSEWQISGLCEHCFDEMYKEEEDE